MNAPSPTTENTSSKPTNDSKECEYDSDDSILEKQAKEIERVQFLYEF